MNTQLIQKFRADPGAFVRRVLRATPTVQQTAVLDALAAGERRIAISSGHGTGKSALLAWLILWFLFCYKDARVPVTAGTQSQLTDTLWPEIMHWLRRMPMELQRLYTYQSQRLSITAQPETWFAVARTARSGSTEALQGFHGNHLLFLVDEASGVPDEVFRAASGALTSATARLILTGNPTRTNGYFFDAFHKAQARWKTFYFSSLESPLVARSFGEDIAAAYGAESDEYRIRVLGQFPAEDTLDAAGYMGLIPNLPILPTLRVDQHLGYVRQTTSGVLRLGIDVAGMGKNRTVWVVRSSTEAWIVAREALSEASEVAQKTITMMQEYGIPAERVYVDGFGIGSNTVKALALSGYDVQSINVGDKPQESERFLNIRAEAGWRVREWLARGGELRGDAADWASLCTVRYRANLKGKIQLMTKEDMQRRGIASPDEFDALMLTCVDALDEEGSAERVDVARLRAGYLAREVVWDG